MILSSKSISISFLLFEAFSVEKKLLKIKIYLKWQLDLRKRKFDFSRNVKCCLFKDCSNMLPQPSVLESGTREKPNFFFFLNLHAIPSVNVGTSGCCMFRDINCML